MGSKHPREHKYEDQNLESHHKLKNQDGLISNRNSTYYSKVYQKRVLSQSKQSFFKIEGDTLDTMETICENERAQSLGDSGLSESELFQKGAKNLEKGTNDPNKNIIFNAQSFIRISHSNFAKNYSLIELIGKGGNGDVYRAKHNPTGQYRAVKIPKQSPSDQQQTNKLRLLDEAKLILALDHPNITKIYEIINEGSTSYVAMEFYSGGSLYDNYKRPEFCNERTIASIAKQILYSLNYLHSKRIIHKDIKLDNVLVSQINDDGPVVKLIDFGVSQVKISETDSLSDPSGTILYMAPEIFGRNYDEKVDLWACGIILYIMVTKEFPFNGHTIDQIRTEVCTKKLNYSGKKWETVSPPCISLIRSLLEKDPNKRLSAATALNHDWILKLTRKRESIPCDLIKLPEGEEFMKIKSLLIGFMFYNIASEQEKEPYYKLFRALDNKSKGYLDVDDLVRVFRSKIDSETEARAKAEDLIKTADFDQSGRIELMDFVIISYQKSLFKECTIKTIFKLIDKDEDGYIYIKDLTQTFKYTFGITSSMWKSFINFYASGEDRKLSRPEFAKIFA